MESTPTSVIKNQTPHSLFNLMTEVGVDSIHLIVYSPCWWISKCYLQVWMASSQSNQFLIIFFFLDCWYSFFINKKIVKFSIDWRIFIFYFTKYKNFKKNLLFITSPHYSANISLLNINLFTCREFINHPKKKLLGIDLIARKPFLQITFRNPSTRGIND